MYACIDICLSTCTYSQLKYVDRLLTGRCSQVLHSLTTVSFSNNTLQNFICRYYQLLKNGLKEQRRDAITFKLASTVLGSRTAPF